MTIKRHTAGGEKIKRRKVGDAPAIGNVQRASSDTPVIRKRRNARPVIKHKKPYPKHFFSWAALALSGLVSVATVAWVKHGRDKELQAETAMVADEPIDLDLIFEDEEESASPEFNSDIANKILSQALANRDPALIKDFFILPGEESPEQAMEELSRIIDAEGAITHTDWLGLKFPNGSTSRQLVVYTEKDGVERIRIAQFVPDSDGKWRIDFDAYLRKCDPPLAEVISAKSGTFMVRVFVAKDRFHDGIYSDKSLWRAYALSSPDMPEPLYAYTKRGSSQDLALTRIIDADEKFRHATLSITKQPDSGPRQFEISRVIAENWIIGAKDFDESF